MRQLYCPKCKRPWVEGDDYKVDKEGYKIHLKCTPRNSFVVGYSHAGPSFIGRLPDDVFELADIVDAEIGRGHRVEVQMLSSRQVQNIVVKMDSMANTRVPTKKQRIH